MSEGRRLEMRDRVRRAMTSAMPFPEDMIVMTIVVDTRSEAMLLGSNIEDKTQEAAFLKQCSELAVNGPAWTEEHYGAS